MTETPYPTSESSILPSWPADASAPGTALPPPVPYTPGPESAPPPAPPPVLPDPARSSPFRPGAMTRALQTLLGGPGGSIVRIAAVFYGIVLLFALGYAVFGGVAGRLFGERMPTGNGLLFGLILGLAIAGACQVLARTLPVVSASADELQRILGPMSWGAVAALALASGIAEEMLFRGALWPHLGLAGSTLLFGLVHFVPKRSLVFYPVFALGAGFLIGLLRGGTENVIPCVLAHVTVNGVNLAWLESRRRRTEKLAAPAVPAAPPAA